MIPLGDSGSESHDSLSPSVSTEMNNINSDWKARFTAIRSVPLLERLDTYRKTFSPGDRVIFYVLAGLLCLSSLASVFALEQSLLVQVPTYGGSVTEGAIGNPQFINPLLAISDADRDLSALTYAGLMGLSGSGALVPVLAESYEISSDGKSYTFVLRDNAKFSDGTPVTANDVVFTIRKAQDPALKSPEYANWSGVTVVAVDTKTVRFSLTRPYAPFLGLTTLGILPARLWQNIADTEFPFSTLETNPVGNGPFKVSTISRNASGLIQSVTLVPNQYYALGRPYLDKMVFNFYSTTEDLSRALSDGSIESAYGVRAESAIDAPYSRVFGVFFNQNEKPVYARTEVRKALSFALDREDIVAKALSGHATPIMGPVPPGESITQVPVPSVVDPTAAAAEILEAAGWSYDDTLRQWKNAKAKLSLDTITLRTSNVPELKNVASAVKDAWEKLGVAVDIELYESGDLSQNVIRPRKYEALLYGMVIGRDQDLYAFWSSKERNDPGLNIALYANKTVDALLENARGLADENDRAANLQKIENLIAAEYPAAFIYAPSFVYAIPSDLYGVELPRVITPSDRFATAATWYRSTDSVWPFFAKK